MKQRAVIIVPTYNEKENVRKLIPVFADIFATIKNWDMHVLIVDDTSPDDTAGEVRKLMKTYPWVHLHVNAKKNGLGAAYLSGMKEAFTNLDADVIFEFDADFSHDPTKIPAILAKVDEGYDMVMGSRYIKGGGIPQDWGLYRQFLSVIGNLFIVLVFTDFRIRDWTGGYRAITRKVYDAVGHEMTDPKFSGYTFQVGFLRKVVLKGFKVAEVPFHFVDRKVGKSKMGSETITTTLKFVLDTRLAEITQSHVFKFAIVGGIGFVVTSVGTFLFPRFSFVTSASLALQNATHLIFLNPSGVASIFATELAIISNFTLNNFFTFTDRKLKLSQVPSKFIQFNIGSLGAMIITLLIVGTGTAITGSAFLSKFSWLIIATLIAMIVNYTVYSKLIWKKK